MRSTRVMALTALAVLCATLPAAAEDDRKFYSGEVADLAYFAIKDYNELSAFPLPELDADRLDDLLKGEVVRMRWKQPVPGAVAEEGEDEPKARHRVVAFYLIEKPRIDVWMAAMDPHTQASDKITEVRLGQNGAGDSRWYQFMDLPWPIENRHWVIDVRRTPAIAQATNGTAWEVAWFLVKDGRQIALDLAKRGEAGGVKLGDAESAVYLKANTGAWAMFELSPDLTLLTYQLTVVLGGMLPEGLAARFAMRELKSLCHRVEETAEKFPEHYDAEHEIIFGGDGLPISRPAAAAVVSESP